MVYKSAFWPTGMFPDDYFPDDYFPDDLSSIVRQEKYDFFVESRVTFSSGSKGTFNIKSRTIFYSKTNKR